MLDYNFYIKKYFVLNHTFRFLINVADADDLTGISRNIDYTITVVIMIISY